ncbi:MAG: hypothetical protein ABC360_04245 [Acetomicrobium sp.]
MKKKMLFVLVIGAVLFAAFGRGVFSRKEGVNYDMAPSKGAISLLS